MAWEYAIALKDNNTEIGSEMDYNMTKKQSSAAILLALAFMILLLGVAVGMNVKSAMDQQKILEESIKSQLIFISATARNILDVDAFIAYDNPDVAGREAYQQTLMQLRNLCDSANAKYIYALKKVNDEYVFVFDTDVENESIFIPYDLASVHEQAFLGMEAADLNITDEYGNFHTGAVPIYKDGSVVGVISTDIEDNYLALSQNTTLFNSLVLITILVLTMGIILFVLMKLLRRTRTIQSKLEQMAHYDGITGLPNRQYLLEFLNKITTGGQNQPFALFFIDLDNFKSVNDNAGHDAGDELLRYVAQYLDSASDGSKAFRPSAGMLNIAARIGGDEFIQLISNVDSVEKAQNYAQHLLDDFHKQNTNRYVEKYHVSMSIGIALYPYHTDNYHVLIKYADIAMYYAKRAGKNQICVYSDEMSKED